MLKYLLTYFLFSCLFKLSLNNILEEKYMFLSLCNYLLNIVNIQMLSWVSSPELRNAPLNEAVEKVDIVLWSVTYSVFCSEPRLVLLPSSRGRTKRKTLILIISRHRVQFIFYTCKYRICRIYFTGNISLNPFIVRKYF